MKKLTIVLLALLLPMISLAQSSVSQTESAEACYKKGEEFYDKKDYKQAIEWYQKAANQGHAPAQYNLGVMYKNGYNVTKDDARALEWYQKSANQGYAPAQNSLGLSYSFGSGVTRDETKALEWYQKSANQGYAPAQCNLGNMYLFGHGVAKDYAKALDLFKKAINQGEPLSQVYMGYMYENGWGVTKDYTKAIELYQKAINDGEDLGEDYLESLQKKLAKEQKNLAEEKNAMAQKANTPKSVEKSNGQPKVQPQSQLKVGLDVVDRDIPVVGRVNRNTFALIFANENYTRETKVDYARNDGEVFHDYCRKTLGLPEKNVHYMPDATLNDLIGELDWLRQVCEAFKGDASIIFYYAGHGIPDEASGSAYLLPTDGNSRILRTCFSIDELYKTLGSMPAKKVTVLMDACFSGAKRSGGMLASARGVAIKAKAAAPKGSMIVLTAAQGDETAYKYEDAKHGLFTYFLLKKLKDSKGSVTMGELSNYIQDQVGRYSIVENGKSQTPSIMTSDNLRNSWKSLTFY